jgi:hypothetical protein
VNRRFGGTSVHVLATQLYVPKYGNIHLIPNFRHPSPQNKNGIDQAFRRRPAFTTARVRAQDRLSGICGGKCETGVGFLQHISFPGQFPFHKLSHSGYNTSISDVPTALSLSLLHEKNKSAQCLIKGRHREQGRAGATPVFLYFRH